MLERLPRTIRDAVHLTRALGLRYLWVDSLCIFQDSIEDWKSEVSMLPSYLSNSAITLAASSSASLADGFLSPIKSSPCFVFPIKNADNDSHLEVLLRPALASAWDSLQGDPLMKRLWCLPEIILSPRVIHFGSSRLVWSCGTVTSADDSDMDRLPIWSEHFKLDCPWNSSTTTQTAAVYEIWHGVVSYASRLKTTLARDRLPAISGLASMTALKLGADTYLAGLWRNNLARDLLWRRDRQTLRRLDIDCLSWTWAAYSGAITFRLLSTESELSSHSFIKHSDQEGWETRKWEKGSKLDDVEGSFIAIADIIDIETFSKNENLFIEGKAGRLRMDTFYLPYARIDEIFGETLISKRTMIDVPERSPGWFTTSVGTSFAILGRRKADLPMRELWYGLLLEIEEDSSDYVRAGVVTIEVSVDLKDSGQILRSFNEFKHIQVIR